MIVPLSDNIRIASDEHCWKLERKRTRKGRDDWASFKYFNTFGQALSEAGQREIRLSRAETITEALADIDQLATRLGALFDFNDAVIKNQEARLRPAA